MLVKAKKEYQRIKNNLLPLLKEGAIGEDDKLMFARHLNYLGHNNLTIVEIGSWLGCGSTLFLARRVSNSSIIYAVDPWDSNLRDTIPRPEIYQGIDIYRQFLSNMIHLGIQDKVIPLRGLSEYISKKWPRDKKIDLLWIDGVHDKENVMKDIKNWTLFVRKGGIICGDDYHHLKIGFIKQMIKGILKRLKMKRSIIKILNLKGNGVVEAVHEAENLGLLNNVEIVGCHWWCKKQ